MELATTDSSLLIFILLYSRVDKEAAWNAVRDSLHPSCHSRRRQLLPIASLSCNNAAWKKNRVRKLALCGVPDAVYALNRRHSEGRQRKRRNSRSTVAMQEVERAGFDFIITPLQRPIRGVAQREFVPDDLTPISGETGNQVSAISERKCLESKHGWQIVGQVTTDEGALEQQIEWAMHCGIHAVVISLTPKSHDLVHIARVVNSVSFSLFLRSQRNCGHSLQKLEGSVSNMAYWIHIKLNDGCVSWHWLII